jgi:hypothetical protein
MRILLILGWILFVQIYTQPTHAQTIPTNGLVAWYPFNGNANDESGNGNSGTVNGATLTTDRFGKANSAYSFNSNTISVPHNPALGITQNSSFTIGLWAFRTGSQTTQHLIGKRPSGAQTFNWQMAFNMGSNEGLLFSGNANSTTYGATSGKDCPINVWVNLVGVYESNSWHLYENGVLIASKTSTLFASDVNTPLTIGNAGGFEPFIGKLDDIGIWNRALSALEIQQLYQSTLNTAPKSIQLSSNSVKENKPVATTVATLATIDDEGGTMTYRLATGTGDTDNASFVLDGNQLKTAQVFNQVTKSIYSIRIRVTDNGALSFEKDFIINVLPSYLPDNGLVAWYPFNNNSNDLSGNGNNSINNTASLSTDRYSKSNSAYSFDGITSYIQIPFSNSINSIQSGLTISTWILMNGGTSAATPPRVIELRGTNGVGGNAGFVILSQGNSNVERKFEVRWYSNTSNISKSPTSPVSSLVWHHLVYTADGNTAQGKFYVDGILINSNEGKPFQGIINSCNYSNQSLYIGAEPNLLGKWGGKIDDIGIWSRALSGNEVSQLYATKSYQKISFNQELQKTYGDSSFELVASSDSGLPITFQSSNDDIAIINGKTVTVLSAGTVTITATQDGNDQYFAAEPVSRTLTIEPANQIITFSVLNDVTESAGSFNLSATSTSGLPVTFTTSELDKITITGSTATIKAPGNVTITAVQNGNTNYNAATSVSQTICINPKKPGFTSSGIGTETVTLTSSSLDGNQWYKNDQPLSGQTSPALVINSNGVYKLRVTKENCSSEFSDEFTFVITDINDKDTSHEISLYPNPVKHELQIILPQGKNGELTDVTIFDMNGKEACVILLNGKYGIVDIEGLLPGTYLMKVSKGDKITYKRFIKQ